MIPALAIDVSVLAPIGFVAIGAMGVLLGEVALSRATTLLGRVVTDAYIGSLLSFGAMASLLLAIYVAVVAFANGGGVFSGANPMFQLDRFAAYATVLVALAALLVCALSIAYLAELRINHGEFYALVLLSTAGMMLLVGAIDLLALFIGLELMSLPVYVLAGFDRSRLRSNEAAMKHFLIGAFASAVMLYGMALLYGATGSTSYYVIRDALDPNAPMAAIGLALVVVGFAFKVAAVPFHQWAPDVYEGAPVSVTAFLSVAVKIAAFVALMRFVAEACGAYARAAGDVLGVLAVLSMLVGNLMAVIQENVKRMLAYSGVAHAGYLLVGVAAADHTGYTAVAFYLVVYLFVNLGAFGVVIALAERGRECERLSDFAGLARRQPGLAALMVLFLLALAGIPGTAGFMAKFNIVLAAVHAGMIWLPLLLVATSVVSVYTYLRIPVQMYMREPESDFTHPGGAFAELVVLGVCAVAIAYLGVFPEAAAFPVLEWAGDSVQQFFGS